MNDQLAPAPLEDGSEAERQQPFRPLDGHFVAAERLGGLIGVGVLVVVGSAGLGFAGLTDKLPSAFLPWCFVGVGLLAVALGLFSWAWPVLQLRVTRYRLGPAALEIRRGIVVRRWTSVPRSRIQHTDVSSGPIQRRYGLAKLVVHTAGTSFAQVELSGLARTDAEALRDELMRGLMERVDDGV